MTSLKSMNVFIDFKKAFDRVCHTGLLRVLQHYNIPRKLVSLIQSLCSRAVSAVRVGSDVSSWFNQTVGVRQGCILSPDLFHFFLEHILNEALQTCQGSARINGRCVSNLRFADDIDLIGENTQDAQDMLNSVHTWSKTYGLEISKEKTKVLVASTQRKDSC